MTFSKTLNREVQPSDFRVQIGKTVSRLEVERMPVEPMVRAELIGALAGELAKHNTIRKEEQHSITYMLDFFIIPVDDFMGLVNDMARAILQTSTIEQQEGQPSKKSEIFKRPECCYQYCAHPEQCQTECAYRPKQVIHE